MTEPVLIRVTLSRTRRNVLMKGNTWSDTFPVAKLEHWRAFYARLAKRGKKQAEAYGPTVSGLDAVIEELKAEHNKNGAKT